MKKEYALCREGFDVSFRMRAAKRAKVFFAAVFAGCGGCRILETGYGDGNIVVRTSADAASSAAGATKSAVAWTEAAVLSFADDLTPDQHARFIAIGEHSAAAYRIHPDLPDGYAPLSQAEFEALDVPSGRYLYEAASGYVEDSGSAGFGARLSRRKDGGKIVVAFRGSNSPGEDEHWMQDWIDDTYQGGGGIPIQYSCGAELLSAVRRAFPHADLTVAGHSLGGGIAAYATIMLGDAERIFCATYNAAGISRIVLMSLPAESVARAASLTANIRSKGDPVSAIPGTQLVGEIYEVDNLRFANHSIDGLLTDMRRRAEGRRSGWLRDLFEE